MRLFNPLIVVICLALTVGASSVRSESKLFDELVGEWSGEGALFGAPARFEMKWERALNDRFMKLQFMNSFQDAKGNVRTMRAEGFYKLIDDTSGVGTWHDSRGMILQLQYAVNDSTLTVDWSAEGMESGRTVYRITADDTIEVLDYVMKAGEMQKFGEAKYVRAEG